MLTDRLSERLKELAASAEQLPAGVQDHLAERLAVELDNAVWDAQLRDPAWVDVPEPTHAWLPLSRKDGARWLRDSPSARASSG